MKAQFTTVLVLLASAALSPDVLAQSKTQQGYNQQDGAANSPSDKLDVTDLENKYWAPKDTDFSVVQNRTFTKEHKLFLSAQFGPDLSTGHYVDGNDVGLTGNYFFNERYGIQATYLQSFLQPNDSVGALAGAGGYPNFGIMQNYYGLGFNWVPFYSKMSFLGKKILYFDMAITPTLGMTDYSQQSTAGNRSQGAFTYGIDISQYYFFTSHFAFRIDLKNQWWDEKLIQNHTIDSPAVSAGTPLSTQLDREMIFLFGFTYYFGFGK